MNNFETVKCSKCLNLCRLTSSLHFIEVFMIQSDADFDRSGHKLMSLTERSLLPTMSRVKGQKSKVVQCTACDDRNDAEVQHPTLQVPICHSCSLGLRSKSLVTRGGHHDYCDWCGLHVDLQLLVCDDCPSAFCENCVVRNFDVDELARVINSTPWLCYKCQPTPRFKKLQSGAIGHSNFKRAFSVIQTSVDAATSDSAVLFGELTQAEQNLVSLLRGHVGNTCLPKADQFSQFWSVKDIILPANACASTQIAQCAPCQVCSKPNTVESTTAGFIGIS